MLENGRDHGEVAAWDATVGKSLGRVNDAAFDVTQDGRVLLAGFSPSDANETALAWWRPGKGRPTSLTTLLPDAGLLALANDGARFVQVLDGAVLIRRSNDGSIERILAGPRQVQAVLWRDDGKQLAVMSGTELSVFNVGRAENVDSEDRVVGLDVAR